MEDQCRQQRKTSGKKRSGAGEEPQQNRQTAAELKQYGERQQESWYAHRFHILLCARIAANFSPSCGNKQNWH
ncbi:Uncharacterised protein [Salmonella enterica subsp. enterica serovar Bovismorbificans]|uniref:Uncharacterized protein n=1 Tax=Salmonella enterica subsp. enterica serovar Bovismorbificans TaxID=58097 RepID=A0A655DMV5_SALET|nr:Uncharacterised protein [Salmonella enterica subsp. enterica serovar Bovismorbificans]